MASSCNKLNQITNKRKLQTSSTSTRLFNVVEITDEDDKYRAVCSACSEKLMSFRFCHD